MKKINLIVILSVFFHCMQFHASSDCKKNDTSVMKIRHTSATHSASIKNENLTCPDDLDDSYSFNFCTTYDYLQQGFHALRTHPASIKFSDFLQYETGYPVDARKKLDAVIVQKAENFIAEGIKNRFWQKLMVDALSYKDACKTAWIPSMITSPFLMDSSSQRDPIVTYVIAYRKNFTKSEFLKCIHNKNIDGQTVFDLAMQDYDKNFRFIDMIIEIEPNIYLHNSNYFIPLLSWAIKNNRPQAYTPLISHENIDFNLQDSHGWTALHHAVYQHDFNAVQLLLQYGLNKLHLNIQDNEGKTALHKRARLEGYDKVLILLLQAGALVDIEDHKGKTPIDIAHTRENIELLLQYKKRQELSI